MVHVRHAKDDLTSSCLIQMLVQERAKFYECVKNLARLLLCYWSSLRLAARIKPHTRHMSFLIMDFTATVPSVAAIAHSDFHARQIFLICSS